MRALRLWKEAALASEAKTARMMTTARAKRTRRRAAP
jgi:hypothetical protein